MELKHKQLVLHPIKLEDIPTLLSQPQLFLQKYKFTVKENWPHHGLRGFLPFYHEAFLNKQEWNGYGAWVMVVGSKIVGDITIKRGLVSKKDFEIGYYVCKKDRNNSYATAALSLICFWTFQQGYLDEVYAECFSGNKASQKVLKKVGFSCVKKDKDILIFSLKKADFPFNI